MKQWRSLAFFLAFGVLIVACGPDSASPGTPAPVPTSPTTQTPPPSNTSTTAASRPTTTDTVAPTTSTSLPGWIDIVIEDGVPRDGVTDIEVARGDTVRLRVVSDVADHVHVHGFDLFFDLTPGEPVEVVFEATGLGVFEIELEQAHTLIAKLTVR